MTQPSSNVKYQKDQRDRAKGEGKHLLTLDVTGQHLTKEQSKDCGNIGRATYQMLVDYPEAREMLRLGTELTTRMRNAGEEGHARLYIDVEFDPEKTDDESIATALDRLLETAMSTPGILDDYGEVEVGEFYVGPNLTFNTEELARKVIRRYEEFMSLKATGHQLHMFMSKNRITTGCDWSGSTKGMMAKNYATQDRVGGANTTIRDSDFEKLKSHFGTKGD